MTKKFLFLGLVGAVWASAQTATLPPGQDQAINSAIHFFQDLKTLMDNTVNASRSPLMAVGCFLWFFFAAKTFFQLVGHFAKETVSGHHHNHLLQGLYLWFIRISVAAMLLIGYFSPTYNGLAFSKIIPGIAHYLSSAIELDAVKSVFVQFNAVFHMATPNAWNLLM